jgi:hypothetical protein
MTEIVTRDSMPQGKAWSTVKPLFETHLEAAIARRTAIFKQRGSSYGNTWGECRFNKMRAVAKALDLDIKPEFFRALATAAFVDMKDERLNGGWDFDHLDDGANYLDFLNEEMRQLLNK